MKLVRAIVHPYNADAIRSALQKAGIRMLTMTQVCDHRSDAPSIMSWRGATYDVGSSRELRLMPRWTTTRWMRSWTSSS